MKILVIKNKGVKEKDLNKLIDEMEQYDKDAPLILNSKPRNFEFTYITAEVPINMVKSGTNSQGRSYYTANDIKRYLRGIVPVGMYHAVFFVYDTKQLFSKDYIAPITHFDPLYFGTQLVQCPSFADGVNVLYHEWLHCERRLLNATGLNLPEQMDTTIVNGVSIPYYQNNKPLTIGGNYHVTFKLQDPHLNRIKNIPMDNKASVIASIMAQLKVLYAKLEASKKKYSEEFEKAVIHVLNFEGGYINNPLDKGGETKYGISKRAYPTLDIKNLTKETATEIYYRDYWLASSCDRMEYNVALIVFDMSVNHGVSRSIKILQKVLKVTEDGIIGMQTLGALRTDTQFPMDILKERTHFYLSLPSVQLKEFGRGWLNRVFDLLNLIYIK